MNGQSGIGHREPARIVATVSSRCSVYRRSGDTQDREPSGEQAEPPPEWVSDVDIDIVWIPSARPGETSANRSSVEDRHGRFGIKRVVTHGPAHTPDSSSPTHHSPDGKQPDDDLVAQRPLVDAVSGCMAGEITAPLLQSAEEFWVTPVCNEAAALAEGLGDLQKYWHDLVVGAPVREFGTQLGLAPASAGLVGAIASALPLPGDTTIKDMRRYIQLTGIVTGAALGYPLMVNACVKSLIHDVVTDLVATTIRDFFGPTFEEEPARAVDDPTTLPEAVEEEPARAVDDPTTLPEAVEEEPARAVDDPTTLPEAVEEEPARAVRAVDDLDCLGTGF